MVNPLKHVNKLNDKDLKEIYNNLCKKYERTRDFNTKKNLNQQILILILLCRRFPVQDLVKVGYDFFRVEPQNSLLYNHLLEHSLNNYCKIDGLLLTNNHNQELTVEDIENILLDIDMGDVKKELSVESLCITNSMLNDYGKKKFDKRKIRQYIQKRSSSIELNEDIKEIQMVKDEDFKFTDRIIDEIAVRLIEHLDERIPNDAYSREIKEINEKQDILEDSLSNKHNQLSNKMAKIHQKIKASNRKYREFNTYFNEIALIKDSLNTNLAKQDEKLVAIEDKFDEIMEKLDENAENCKSISNVCKDKDENIMSDNRGSNKMQVVIDEVNYRDIKEFVYNWFNHNLKISRNIHDTVTIEEITAKINKDIDSQDIDIDMKLLSNRMESYLYSWYNKHNPTLSFKDIKNTSIKGNEFYSKLKFININEERENRIKNIIVEWLNENTCEVEGSKTYTRQIFDKIEPLFAQNGWLITTPEEWKELHNAGFSKAVPARTFSQIIGKAVQEVYQSISKDTIQRDTSSSTGNVTWYPNIEILDKQVSDNLQSSIKDELSNDIFDSDNIIYTWLKNNLIYTSRDDDRIETSLLLENLIKYLQLHEVNISEKALLTFFNNILGVFLNDNHVDLSDSSEIVGFKLLNEYDNRASNIVDNWINNHIIIVDNYNEKTLMEDIKEKVLSALYHEGISMVNNDVFIQLPDELKSNFIIESEFHEHIQKALIEKVGSDRIFNNPDGSYVEQIQIMKYKALTEEDLREWINSNLEELLKANVANKKNIIDNFSRYLKEQNIKNTTQHSIEQLIDAAMKDYYANVSEVTLKLLNDSQNEYYVLVSD